MSTNVGVIKILGDPQIRVTTQGSFVGVAQAKGTATDLLLTVSAGPDGGTAIAGTSFVAVQGANVTASTSTTWANVAPDKGAWTSSATGALSVTTTGQSVAHLQNLQFAFYRVTVSNTTTATINVSTNFAYMPMGDSFDATAA
jgi:hypothetical protein